MMPNYDVTAHGSLSTNWDATGDESEPDWGGIDWYTKLSSNQWLVRSSTTDHLLHVTRCQAFVIVFGVVLVALVKLSAKSWHKDKINGSFTCVTPHSFGKCMKIVIVPNLVFSGNICSCWCVFLMAIYIMKTFTHLPVRSFTPHAITRQTR